MSILSFSSINFFDALKLYIAYLIQLFLFFYYSTIVEISDVLAITENKSWKLNSRDERSKSKFFKAHRYSSPFSSLLPKYRLTASISCQFGFTDYYSSIAYNRLHTTYLDGRHEAEVLAPRNAMSAGNCRRSRIACSRKVRLTVFGPIMRPGVSAVSFVAENLCSVRAISQINWRFAQNSKIAYNYLSID